MRATDSGDACSWQPCGADVDPADPLAVLRVVRRRFAADAAAPAREARGRLARAPCDLRELLAALGEEPQLGGQAVERRREAVERIGEARARASDRLRDACPARRRARGAACAIAGTSRPAASGSSGTSRAAVRAATSASRASSASWPAVTCSPKNSVAVSGSWCASSRITVLQAAGARPGLRRAASRRRRTDGG